MKKIVGFVLYLALSFGLFAVDIENDVSVYNELSSSFFSGFYPGAVEYADKLIKKFPESAYIGSALVMKGESLVRLGRIEEAYIVLNEVQNSDINQDIKNQSKYWLSRAYEYKKEYEDALSGYFDYCEQEGVQGKYFIDSILRAANIYYILQDYKRAVPNYEYIIKNGNKVSSSDYANALLKLCDSYNKSSQGAKTIALYSKFNKDNLDSIVYYALVEFTGDAYVSQKNYKKAYELYCSVLSSGERSLAANALKKAYNVSSEHKKEVGAEPGEVLKNAEDSLKDYPELLGEFWTRLGTDAFYDGDFKKALNYFDEASKTSNDELKEFASIYLAEIEFGKNPDATSAKKAEDSLKASETKYQGSGKGFYKNDYARLFVKYAAYKKNWDEVKSLAKNVNPSDEATNYYLALAEYETGDFAESAKLLSGKNNELFALTLANQQKLKESASVYGSSDKKTGLTSEERLNYSKVLILSGRYRESQIEANKSGLNEGKYILGLAQFNTWSWPYAEESFSSYLKNVDRSDPNQSKAISYAIFYKGYAQYRQGKAKEAFDNLVNFISLYPEHELLWNAEMTAANAAVQLSRYDSAISMADAAIKISSNNENREEAVLLCAEIYSDAKKYESALNLLEPYSKLKNEFGMKSLYQIAQVYEKMQLYAKADVTYKEVSDRFTSAKMAEEAMYRRGELFYAKEDYASALTRFTEYSNRYPVGAFVESSWYFTADCLVKTNNKNKAILQYQALIKKFPESTYIYSSAKDLIDLYREEGKYKNALENARFLLTKYGDQARNDGIAEVATELEKLDSGKNEAMVKKETEYRKSGGLNTPEGRRIGTELVALYSKSSVTANDAVKLAEQLLPLQRKNLKEESLWASQNADILAQSYRAQNKNKQAAEMYLSAAEYYRMNNKSQEAASVLYGAYDAFIAAGLSGDANETAKTLQSLYPDTRQAKAVKTDN